MMKVLIALLVSLVGLGARAQVRSAQVHGTQAPLVPSVMPLPTIQSPLQSCDPRLGTTSNTQPPQDPQYPTQSQVRYVLTSRSSAQIFRNTESGQVQRIQYVLVDCSVLRVLRN